MRRAVAVLVCAACSSRSPAPRHHPDGKVVWDAMTDAPFVRGLALDGDDVVIAEEAGPENRVRRIAPGGGERWKVAFVGSIPRGLALDDDGVAYAIADLDQPVMLGTIFTGPNASRSAVVAAISRKGEVLWTDVLGKSGEGRGALAIAVSHGSVYAVSHTEREIFVDVLDRAGTAAGSREVSAEWNGVEYPAAADHKADAFVARLGADGHPDWLVVGRGTGPAGARDVSLAGRDVVWATGGFDGPITFGTGGALAGEGDGIQSGFAIELARTR